jgi:hypothetical protein
VDLNAQHNFAVSLPHTALPAQRPLTSVNDVLNRRYGVHDVMANEMANSISAPQTLPRWQTPFVTQQPDANGPVVAHATDRRTSWCCTRYGVVSEKPTSVSQNLVFPDDVGNFSVRPGCSCPAAAVEAFSQLSLAARAHALLTGHLMVDGTCPHHKKLVSKIMHHNLANFLLCQWRRRNKENGFEPVVGYGRHGLQVFKRAVNPNGRSLLAKPLEPFSDTINFLT